MTSCAHAATAAAAGRVLCQEAEPSNTGVHWHGRPDLFSPCACRRAKLGHAEAERAALATVLQASLADAEAQASAAQAACGESETGLRSLAQELRRERNAAVEAAEDARVAQRDEAAAAAAAAQRAAAAQAEAAEARREARDAADRASAAEGRADAEAAAAAQARLDAHSAAAAAAAARAAWDASESERAAAESERVQAAGAAAEIAAAERARVAAAEAGAEAEREKMRRVVGVERQRVASLMYKEALHSHTIEEQTRQLEAISAQLAAAQESYT